MCGGRCGGGRQFIAFIIMKLIQHSCIDGLRERLGRRLFHLQENQNLQYYSNFVLIKGISPWYKYIPLMYRGAGSLCLPPAVQGRWRHRV